MATLTINLTIVGETPTGVSLLTFTNADTGADVSGAAGVALPKAFTLTGGTWLCPFTDTGLALYDYTYLITWADTTTTGPLASTVRGSLVTVAGVDATESDLNDWFGRGNIAIWSDLGNTETRDPARITRALAYAGNEVTAFFTDGPYALPFAYLDAASRGKVVKWQTVLAGVWLYRARGQRDEDKDGNKYTLVEEGVMAEMRKYLADQRFRLNVTPANANVPTAPTVLQNSRPAGGYAACPTIVTL